MTAAMSNTVSGAAVSAPVTDEYAEILTPERLGVRRRAPPGLRRAAGGRCLTAAPRSRPNSTAAGRSTSSRRPATIREGDWTVAPTPPDLLDRRVEITGPVDRKMVINALNSGAKVFMADFEDANSPDLGQHRRGPDQPPRRRPRRDRLHQPRGQAVLGSNPQTAVLMVRPRGWHLTEKHVTVDGRPVSGSLFDFGLYLFHNAAPCSTAGTGPYFYLPKLESHLEARLWNDVFVFAQRRAWACPSARSGRRC